MTLKSPLQTHEDQQKWSNVTSPKIHASVLLWSAGIMLLYFEDKKLKTWKNHARQDAYLMRLAHSALFTIFF